MRSAAAQLHITGNLTLIYDEHLRREVHAHAAIEATFTISAAEIGDQIMRGHEVSAVAGLDGGLGQRHGKMRLPDSRGSSHIMLTFLSKSLCITHGTLSLASPFVSKSG